MLGYHLVEQKQPMHKTPSNQSDSPSNQKIRLYDYDEAMSKLLIRGGGKVIARENFIFCRTSLWIFNRTKIIKGAGFFKLINLGN